MKRIALTQEMVAIIDDDDYELIKQHKWYASKYSNIFYAMRSKTIGYKQEEKIRMHRLILGLKKGDKRQVDHIDGNGLNNQKSNLRICNGQQNRYNSKSNKYSVSQYKGVSWCKRANKWLTSITTSGKTVFIGHYDTEQQAAIIYDRVALFEFGEFARTNFPRKNYTDIKLLSVQNILKHRQEKKTSKFMGVSWRRKTQKWIAQIYENKKNIFLGSFDKEKDAAKAYNDAVSQKKSFERK